MLRVKVPLSVSHTMSFLGSDRDADGTGFLEKGPESPGWAAYRVGHQPMLPGLSFCCSLPPRGPALQEGQLLLYAQSLPCSSPFQRPHCFIHDFTVISELL